MKDKFSILLEVLKRDYPETLKLSTSELVRFMQIAEQIYDTWIEGMSLSDNVTRFVPLAPVLEDTGIEVSNFYEN